MAKPRLVARGAEIRRRRLNAMLGQKELAELASISDATISNLELKSCVALPRTIRALAMALGCEPSDIAEVVVEERAS